MAWKPATQTKTFKYKPVCEQGNGKPLTAVCSYFNNTALNTRTEVPSLRLTQGVDDAVMLQQ